MTLGQTPHVQRAEWLGRVVVVAGDSAALADVAAQLVEAGAFVAVVSTVVQVPAAHVAFRAEPADAEVWQRVAPHVEQRLGPVDAVVTDQQLQPLVEGVFGADLRRRGRGAVVGATPDMTADELLSRLADMR